MNRTIFVPFFMSKIFIWKRKKKLLEFIRYRLLKNSYLNNNRKSILLTGRITSSEAVVRYPSDFLSSVSCLANIIRVAVVYCGSSKSGALLYVNFPSLCPSRDNQVRLEAKFKFGYAVDNNLKKPLYSVLDFWLLSAISPASSTDSILLVWNYFFHG